MRSKNYLIVYLIIIMPLILLIGIKGENYIQNVFSSNKGLKLNIDSNKYIQLVHFVDEYDNIEDVFAVIYNIKSTIHKYYKNYVDFITILNKNSKTGDEKEMILEVIKSQNMQKSWSVINNSDITSELNNNENDYWKFYMVVNDKIPLKKDNKNYYNAKSIVDLKRILSDDIKLILYRIKSGKE